VASYTNKTDRNNTDTSKTDITPRKVENFVCLPNLPATSQQAKIITEAVVDYISKDICMDNQYYRWTRLFKSDAYCRTKVHSTT